MTQQQSLEQIIKEYVQILLEDTGMAKLPEQEKKVWEEQLTAAMQKAVIIGLISALQSSQRKQFEDYLASKEIGNALKVLVDGNVNYTDKIRYILSQYNKSFLEKYENTLREK